MTLYINTKDPNIITVALKENDGIAKTLSMENEYGSQVLLPLIIRLLELGKLEIGDLTSVEAETGPGSFTGLKVGASVSQALGFALNIPVNGQIGKPVDIRYT